MWGFGPVHYHKNFHYSLIERIKNISYDNNRQIKNNKNIYRNQEEYLLFKNELKRVNFKTKSFLKDIKSKTPPENLKFYNRGRIDLKNFGSKDNKLEIIESNIAMSNLKFPDWFKSDNGEGMIISSEKGTVDLKLKCINSGTLKIFLRGPDVRDRNNNRFPVYIDFINFQVNQNIIFNDSKLVWHNEPFIFEKEIKNSEIVEIHIDWLPFSKSSIYKK